MSNTFTLIDDHYRPRTPTADLTTVLAGIELPNPIFTASGCSAFGRELAAFVDLTSIGGVITKSVTREPRSGRPTPRMAETPSGMLNSVGLQGPGVDALVERELDFLERSGVRTVVSIAGGSPEEFGYCARKLRNHPAVMMIEMNISCPNVDGKMFATDLDAVTAAVRAVHRETPNGIPVLAKLSADVTDIVELAGACIDAGAHGLSMINTLLGMAIDTATFAPALAGITGGLSGPAIRPIAVRSVYQVRAAFPEIPILGGGGIRTGRDALQFFLAGADAITVGTALFSDPSAPTRISIELAEELAERGIDSLGQVIGLAHRPQEAAALLTNQPIEPEPEPDPDLPGYHPVIVFEDH